jgi:hypothetical protein
LNSETSAPDSGTFINKVRPVKYIEPAPLRITDPIVKRGAATPGSRNAVYAVPSTKNTWTRSWENGASDTANVPSDDRLNAPGCNTAPFSMPTFSKVVRLVRCLLMKETVWARRSMTR